MHTIDALGYQMSALLLQEDKMPARSEEEDKVQSVRFQRPKRAKLTTEVSLKRMEEFPQRKERIVAAVRKSKDQGLSS